MPLVLSPTIRSPAIIFPSSVEVKLKPQVPPQLEAPKPIVALARFVWIVVDAVPLLNVDPPIVSPFDLRIIAPDAMKLLLRFIAPVDSSVIAPAVVMLPVDEANVMSPAEVMALVLMISPVVPDKVIAPCPIIVPPL